MTDKEKVLKVHPRWCEGSDGAIYKNKNRLAWDKVADSWQNAAESLPAQPEQILDGLGEALQRGEVFAQEIGADVPEHVWDEFGLGKVESLPVEAKDCACEGKMKHFTYHSDESCGVDPIEPKPTPSTPSEREQDEKDLVISRLTKALREALTEIADGAAAPELIEHGIQLTISGHYEKKEQPR